MYGFKVYFQYLLLVVLIGIHACRQGEKKYEISNGDSFELAVKQVLTAFAHNDDKLLNNLVNKKVGITILYRNGVFDQFRQLNALDFNKPEPPYLPYDAPTIDTDTVTLVYGLLPEFNCSRMEWNKFGLFCDTAKQDNKLWQTAANLIKYRGDTISEKELSSFAKLAKSSRRVILATTDGGECIFTLTWLDGKWYLTVIDRVTTDCSA